MGTTAAEQLAYLEPKTQQVLYALVGEEITQRTLNEVKELRRQLQSAKENETKAAKLQQELVSLKQAGRAEDQQRIRQLETAMRDLQQRSPEKVEVEVIPDKIKRQIQEDQENINILRRAWFW